MTAIDREDRICVVGAGPGGLSAGAALAARGLPFDIIDAGEGVGGIWDMSRPETPMYESAHFISSRTLSALPGFPMPEDYPDYPRHDLVLEYIRAFARERDLERHCTFGTRVVEARLSGETRWRVALDNGEEHLYAGLVLATGLTWYPRLPDYPGTFDGEARHAFHYDGPDELRGRRVLVVGGGNSACDIACDAARVADRAFISLRRGYRFLPKYVLGKPADVFAAQGPRLPAWLQQRILGFLVDRVFVGDLTRFGLPEPDHRLFESHPIMNTRILHFLGHGDLEARPDVRELRGARVAFADGSEEEVDLVIWATGYQRRFPFLEEDVLDRRDGAVDAYLNVFHRRHPTLAFLGLFETDGAAYPLLGLQADLVAGYLAARRAGEAGLSAFDERRATARPDVRGGRHYLRSARHRYYVRRDLYHRALERERDRMGWSAPALPGSA